MYFEDARGPERLDTTDLMAVATIHKLRLTSTSRPIYLQSSVWNHVPDFQKMRERLLMNRFPSGLVTMLATGKRARYARTPAQIAGNSEPIAAVRAATTGIAMIE